MRKPTAIFGSALFLVIAPGTVGFVVPWWIAGWHMSAPFQGNNLYPSAGVVLVLAGLVPLVESFARFALQASARPRQWHPHSISW